MREIRLEMARLSFIEYCRLLYPNHYKESRKYLTEICDQIQKFMEQNKKHFLVINLPPRHYKKLHGNLPSGVAFWTEPGNSRDDWIL